MHWNLVFVVHSERKPKIFGKVFNENTLVIFFLFMQLTAIELLNLISIQMLF